MRLVTPPHPDARYTRAELAALLGYSVRSMPTIEQRAGLKRIRSSGRVEFWGSEIIAKLPQEFGTTVESAAVRRIRSQAVIERLRNVR